MPCFLFAMVLQVSTKSPPSHFLSILQTKVMTFRLWVTLSDLEWPFYGSSSPSVWEARDTVNVL